MQKVLLLGSSGFIGKQIVKRLNDSKKYQLGIMDRFLNKVRVENLKIEIEDWIPDAVINLASDATSNNTSAIWNANYIYPKDIIEKLSPHLRPITWIQFSSYFQLYYKNYHTDKNTYARAKRFFSMHLNNLENHNIVNFSDVILPHIFGVGEPTYRVIPQMIYSSAHAKPLKLTSGEQILPLLDVEDLIFEIEFLLEQTLNGLKQTGFLQQSTDISLTSIANLIFGEHFDSLAQFNQMDSRSNEFYTNVWKNENQIINTSRKDITVTFDKMRSKLNDL
jgi:nucleoside-diphosphate-sugar epimerase